MERDKKKSEDCSPDFLASKCLNLRLHLLESLDELWKIFDVEHDRRLLTAAALLADLEELAVTGLLEVDVEGALASVDRHAVHIVCKVSATTAATTAWRTRSASRLLLESSRTAHEAIVATGWRRQVCHGIEHKQKGKK